MANAYIERHKAWQQYAKQELAKGRQPVKFKDWKPQNKKGKNARTKQVESGLKAAGIDWDSDKPTSRLKRSR